MKTVKTRGTILPRALALVSLALTLTVAECRAAHPYQPVYPDPVLEPWRWRSFPELKGLGLQCIAEGKDGKMWFGLDEGVRCYDGVNWSTYTSEEGLYGALVTVLCAMRDGGVYAGTEMGISRFSEGTWSRAFPPGGDLRWGIYDLMEASDGSLWAGTVWGALRLNRKQAMLYTTEEVAAALRMHAPWLQLSIVPEEAVPTRSWVEGIGAEVLPRWYFSSQKGPKTVYVLAPGGPAEAAGLRVGDRITAVGGQSTVTQDQLNGPAGTSVRLTVQREGHAEPLEVTVTRGRVEGTFRPFWVYDVYEDRDGRMWFGLSSGLEGGEIIRYNPAAEGPSAWRLYTEDDGLDIGWLPRIIQTRDGSIWTVSAHGRKGVNRFDGKAWTSLSLKALRGSDSNPSILETEDGTLWVGSSGNHLHAYQNGAWTVYRIPQRLSPNVRIFDLLEASDGALWVIGRGREAVRLDYSTSRWMTYAGLHFQCETPDGAQWFLSQDGEIVYSNGKAWTRYGVEDGLMDTPAGLIATREGTLWAGGSHKSTAATAKFDGKRWVLQTHPQLSWGIDRRAVYESRDGSLWFGAAVDPIPERGQLGGVLRFDPSQGSAQQGKSWTHYTPPEAPWYVYGIGQTADGALWVGSAGFWGLRRFDGQTWTRITEPEAFTKLVSIDAIHATPKGDLWVGTRTRGAFHYDEKGWTRHNVQDGLADNRVNNIQQTHDGSVWVTTAKGVSRFDGQTWTTRALLPDLRGKLLQSQDGALWINRRPGRPSGAGSGTPTTIRYEPDADPPETEITLSLDKVSQPGNTTLAWEGIDSWRATPDEDLQYAWRLDGGQWSPFSSEKNRIFQSLSSGDHTFRVKARDLDFNEDPTPALTRFTVIPPVWQEPWFIGLMVVLLGGAGLQTIRVVRRDRSLLAEIGERKQVEVALQELNESLEERVNQRTSELEALYELTQQIGYTLNYNELFRLILTHLRQAAACDVAASLLVMDDLCEIFIQPTRSLSPDAQEVVETRLMDAFAQMGRQKVDREQLHIKTVEAEPFDKTEPPIGDVASSLLAPIADVKGETVGFLFVGAQEEKAFDEDQMRLLYMVANQAAQSIQRLRALLAAERQRLEGLVEHLPDGVYLLDEQRCLRLANPAGQEYLPVLMNAGVGEEITRIGEYRLEDILTTPRANGLAHQVVLEGSPQRAFEVEGRPITERETEGGWVLVVREVTREREMQERVQRQDRLAAVGQLAAGIAHDFNNMLTTMIGFAQILEGRPDVFESAKVELRRISSQGERAAQLIQQILDFSRKSVVQRKPMDLVPFLKEAVKLLDRTLPENIQIVAEFGRGDYIVEANLTQLQEVITNLAVNARDAMPEGGELRIGLSHLRLEPDERPLFPEMAPGDWVVWTVSDTGAGMPPEVVEHIYEPFFTTKPPGQGTGLGLAQVYGIVKQHNGFIDVKSELGAGTTFTSYLPQVALEESPEEEPVEELMKGQGETILVVEDEAEVLQTAKSMLEHLNYRVLTATHGREALAVYDLHRDKISLVLTDRVMPEMGGVELLEALKEKNPEVRLVLMTGYPLGDEEEDPLFEGLAGFLQKPLRLEQVGQKMREVLSPEA